MNGIGFGTLSPPTILPVREFCCGAGTSVTHSPLTLHGFESHGLTVGVGVGVVEVVVVEVVVVVVEVVVVVVVVVEVEVESAFGSSQKYPRTPQLYDPL